MRLQVQFIDFFHCDFLEVKPLIGFVTTNLSLRCLFTNLSCVQTLNNLYLTYLGDEYSFSYQHYFNSQRMTLTFKNLKKIKNSLFSVSRNTK